jgi:hypothetical protein
LVGGVVEAVELGRGGEAEAPGGGEGEVGEFGAQAAVAEEASRGGGEWREEQGALVAGEAVAEAVGEGEVIHEGEVGVAAEEVECLAADEG